MKKTLLITTVVLAIVVAVPKFLSGPINQHIGTVVAKIDNTPGYKVAILEQHAGWFTSSAKINVSFDINTIAAPDQNASNPFEHLNGDVTLNIQHGPILLANGVSLGLAAWSIEADKSLLRDTLTYSDSQSLYRIYGNTGFSGNSQYTDEILKFSTAETQSTFSGWTGKGVMSANGSYYSGVTDGVNISNSDLTSSIDTIALDIQLEGSWLAALENPIYNSTGKLTVGSLNITPAEQSAIIIDDISLGFETQKNADETLVDMIVNYGLKKVESPNFVASDFVMDIEFKNLEKEFLKAYQKVAGDPTGFEAGLQSLIENNLLTQLQASPEINIKELSINIDGKSFSGNLLTKIENVDALPAQLNDPKFWLLHTAASTDIKLDKALALTLGESFLLPQLASNPSTQSMPVSQQKEIVAAQINGTINGLIAQGLIVEKDSGYEANLRLEEGQATINGQVTPLPF